MQPTLIVAHISTGSVLIPLFIAFMHSKKIPIDLKPLWLIFIIALLSDGLSLILIQYSVNTHWIGNVYLVSQFSILVLIFRSQFQRKKITNIVLLLFIVFFTINFFFFEGPWIFNSASNVTASLILIGFCMYYFYQLLNDLPTVHVHRLPMLWISFAVLTYYGGNFFLFLLGNYLVYGEAGSHRLMWILHNLLNIIKNILFAIALWQSYRNMKSSTSSSSAL